MKKFVFRLVNSVEKNLDSITLELKKQLNLFEPISVLPYIMYGSDKVGFVKGRVLEKKEITGASESDTIWRNLNNMYKRFASDEVPGVKLKVYFQNKVYETISDHEGYFEVNIQPDATAISGIWQDVFIEIVDAPGPFTPGLKSEGKILIPSANREFGVISDIDDTIVETQATSLLRMAKNTFINNAKTRLPFEGVATFYRALEKGKYGTAINPFFYVSSSPWNLYDLLLEFLEINNLPLGPLLLKDYGIEEDKIFSKGHLAHKFVQIERILSTYPDTKFILIGDSGQEDAKIYFEVAQSFPDQILAIFIRDVKLPERAQIVADLSNQLKTNSKIPLILVENSVKAAEYAILHGLMSADSLDEIKAEKKKDAEQ